MKKKKIFVKPNKGETVFFEGRKDAIPQDGAEVLPSIYYSRLIIDKSIIKVKKSNKPSKKED